MRYARILLAALLVAAPAIAQTAGRATRPLTRTEPRSQRWRELTYDKVSTHLAFRGCDLWIGTSGGGVIRWDTPTGSFEKYTRVNDKLADNLVNDMALDGGEVWVATNLGLAHWDGRAWSRFDARNSPLNDLVSAVAVDAAGVKWIGTYASGLFRFDGSQWTVFNGSNSGLSDDFVTSIEFDSSGKAWIGVWSDGVDCFDGTNWANFDPTNSGLLSFFVHVKATHPTDGTVWFWCADDSPFPQVGTVRFDGTTWTTFRTSNSGIHSDYIHSIAIDLNENVWFQGIDAISRLAGAAWTVYPNIPSFFDFNLPRGKSVAIKPNGEVWAGTAFGFARFDGVGFVGMATPDLWDNDVRAVAVENGTVWIGTRAGLQAFDQGSWQRFTSGTSPLPGDEVESLAVEPGGGLLIGTRQGAARLDGGTWTTWTTANSGIHANQILAVEVAAGGARWFGSSFLGSGVSVLQGGSWTKYTAQNSGLVHNTVRAITSDPTIGAVWFATPQGASRFQDGSWMSFTTAQGLVHDSVEDIAVTPGGVVWFATQGGVSALSDGVFTNYTSANGLPENRTNVVTFGRGGRVWVGFQNLGAARFNGRAWHTFDLKNGLTNDRVQAIATDAAGTVWLGTSFGVGYFNAKGL